MGLAIQNTQTPYEVIRSNTATASEAALMRGNERTPEAVPAQVNRREYMLAFIESASDEQAAARVAAYRNAGGAQLQAVNLKAIMEAQAAGRADVAERIHRLNDRFRQESDQFRTQEMEVIDRGNADGKTSKEILADLIALHDDQSDFFKLSIGWEGKLLSDPESYAKLVSLTPDYVNAYA